jgi:hypothetical protein
VGKDKEEEDMEEEKEVEEVKEEQGRKELSNFISCVNSVHYQSFFVPYKPIGAAPRKQDGLSYISLYLDRLLVVL